MTILRMSHFPFSLVEEAPLVLHVTAKGSLLFPGNAQNGSTKTLYYGIR